MPVCRRHKMSCTRPGTLSHTPPAGGGEPRTTKLHRAKLLRYRKPTHSSGGEPRTTKLHRAKLLRYSFAEVEPRTTKLHRAKLLHPGKAEVEPKLHRAKLLHPGKAGVELTHSYRFCFYRPNLLELRTGLETRLHIRIDFVSIDPIY